MSYLNITEVESALVALASAYPSICELITLPNLTIEGRTCHAVRIGKFGASDRDAVLLTGAVHAREWGGAEICVNVAADLCEAYTAGTGLGYGGKHFTSAEVRRLSKASICSSSPMSIPMDATSVRTPRHSGERTGTRLTAAETRRASASISTATRISSGISRSLRPLLRSEHLRGSL